MNAVATIQARMEEQLAFRNGEVVVNAHRLFLKEGATPCCSYYGREHEFRLALRDYTFYKQQVHRVRRRCGSSYTGYELKAAACQEVVHEMWPCAECIRRDNPTGRHKFEGVRLPRERVTNGRLKYDW